MDNKNYEELKQKLKVSMFVPSHIKEFILNLERNDFVADAVQKFLSKYNWQQIPTEVWVDIYQMLMWYESTTQKQDIQINLNI